MISHGDNIKAALPEGVACTIRESKRARSVTLKFHAGNKLEVVVPVGFDQGYLGEILVHKKDWIHQAVERLRQRAEIIGEDSSVLPVEIFFKAVDRRFEVLWEPGPTGTIRLTEESPSRLVVWGDTANEALCRKVLHQWLRRQGESILCPWLEFLSRETGIKYDRVRIRGQKTRWGSCSTRGNINLNQKMLFLEAQLVRYILIHELCHRVHLNHSPQYWKLVSRFEPNCMELDKKLTRADSSVPAWAH